MIYALAVYWIVAGMAFFMALEKRLTEGDLVLIALFGGFLVPARLIAKVIK